LSASAVWTQNSSDFFVVNVKGKITKKTETQKWRYVDYNDRLTGNDEINIGENSFINLYDKANNKYFVIHGKRNIKIKDLCDNKFIKDEKPVNGILVKAFESLANAFSGFAESRSLKNLFRSSDIRHGLLALMPRNTKITGDTIVFEWIANDKSRPVKLLLLDENFNHIFDTVIVGNNVCSFTNKMVQNREYVWQISAADNKNIINYFSIPGDEELSLFRNRLDSLDKIIFAPESPNYYILKGMLCEESGYSALAYSELKKAYFLSVEKEKYGKIIEEFLNRQKINIKYTDVLPYR